MAISNHERVGKAMDALKDGLAPFVERELRCGLKGEVTPQVLRSFAEDSVLAERPIAEWDAAALLKLMWDAWNEVFRNTLGFAERSFVSELRETRNKWAHQQTFSSDDAYRALDSVDRLLTAISAPQAEDVERMKNELLRVRYDEQMRSEKRRSTSSAIESQVTGSLKPWREVVTPHKDVASGRYQQAEFAADLWQVHIGEGSDEYRDPAEFFRRTYLTESLRRLLTDAVRRLSGLGGGDPVVQLQTNFGGGKTHSMLAVYHLFSGATPGQLQGLEEVMGATGVTTLPKVKRVVLVGNRISPGNPSVKADGTVVRTLWGELAWQLGGKTAFQRIAADDEKATSPGDALRELMNEYGPCLILIDEWVAYARQLHDGNELPAGSFETHFTFAQALTESAKLAKDCLLVISLPASDTPVSPHARADDVEVGGERGRAALERLRNAVGRVEASWRPASAEEGFEIVRRRLFEPLTENNQFVARDTVARAFYELYRTQNQEFPPECRESGYEKRMKAAYPIHPEVFDRLYGDWSTLLQFQRTRGVLRLMAAVIHSLWKGGDRNPLIMPANISIDDPRVQFELTRYLSDNWVPVLEKDVDGPNALPIRLDGEVPNLGKFAACQRVARTVYLGSAPTATAANRGIEDRRIKLGCVMPGESPAIFGDALRRMSATATYLYQDGSRYWYSTQPTVTKLAEDRAEQLKRDPDRVSREVGDRLRSEFGDTHITKKDRYGDFSRVHLLPQSSQDVPDDTEARLVVLGIDVPYSKDPACPALKTVKEIFEMRGTSPRLYRNTLVFLVVDEARMQDLDEVVRRYLSWDSILNEKKELNLDPNQERQAGVQKASADAAVTAQIPEAYQWLLVPVQSKPQDPMEWRTFRLTGVDSLAVRASKKLRSEDHLTPVLAGTLLRLWLDRIPLWRGDHVEIKQLAEDFARYLYLPRLTKPAVLIGSINDGLGQLLWQTDTFAHADSYDEATKRYRGLRCGKGNPISDDNFGGLLVKPNVTQQQITAEQQSLPQSTPPEISTPTNETGHIFSPSNPLQIIPARNPTPRRFHGNVTLDDTRVGRDAGRVAEEVIAHLVGLQGAKVNITLEIEAEIPDGAPEHVVRTVTENCRTLKFVSQGFEEE